MTSFLRATAKGTDSNSYLTVRRAEEILGPRLYTTKWDEASSTPDADGYLANATGSIGASSIAVDTGTGTFVEGTVFRFAGHSTKYAVSGSLDGAGTLSFTPALTAAVANNEELRRVTPSSREKSLIWATSILDSMVDWYGWKRTVEQSLRWPRSGVVDRDGHPIDYDTIPADLEEATAELALALLDKDRWTPPSVLAQGLEEATVGPLSIKISGKFVEDTVPKSVLALISHLGTLNPAAVAGSTQIVKLLRS
jgi:DnaT-like ssDNA binding protein